MYTAREGLLLTARITLGRFDLDDRSPEVSKDTRTELIRAGGKVYNTPMTERCGHLCGSYDM
jgi:hypothetical protein